MDKRKPVAENTAMKEAQALETQGFSVAEKQKPPLGVMPEFIWKRKRYRELCEAIGRYVIEGFEPLPEWIIEGKKLLEEIS